MPLPFTVTQYELCVTINADDRIKSICRISGSRDAVSVQTEIERFSIFDSELFASFRIAASDRRRRCCRHHSQYPMFRPTPSIRHLHILPYGHRCLCALYHRSGVLLLPSSANAVTFVMHSVAHWSSTAPILLSELSWFIPSFSYVPQYSLFTYGLDIKADFLNNGIIHCSSMNEARGWNEKYGKGYKKVISDHGSGLPAVFPVVH